MARFTPDLHCFFYGKPAPEIKYKWPPALFSGYIEAFLCRLIFMINTVRYTLLREQILEIAVGLGCLTSQQQAEILRIQAKLKADHDAASAPHSRLSPLTLQAQIAALPQILEAVKDPQFADNNPEAEILYLKLKYGPFPMSFMRPTAALQNWVVKLCIGCVSLHYSTVLDIEPPAHSIKRWIFRFYHFEL